MIPRLKYIQNILVPTYCTVLAGYLPEKFVKKSSPNVNNHFNYIILKILIISTYKYIFVVSVIAEDPEFTEPITNVTVPAGRNVKLGCSVRNLGSYKV